MKKKLSKMAAISGCIVCACGFTGIVGSGKVITEERKLDEFERIKAASSAEVIVHTSAEPRVVVKTDDNLMQYVETKVGGGELVIKVQDNHSVKFTKIEVEVWTKTLSGVSLAGSGNVVLADEVKATSFKATLSGSGNMKGKVLCSDELNVRLAGSGDMQIAGSAAELEVNVAGSGDFTCTDCAMQRIDASIAGSGQVTLKGKATKLKASISGSGDVHARALEAQAVNLSITGSGDMDVWAVQTLDASIFGSGDIKYKGSPQVNQTIRGSGSIRGGS